MGCQLRPDCHREDVISASVPTFQVALCYKLAVCPLHRHYAELQLLCQLPLGGELFAGNQVTGFNLAADILIKLQIEGLTSCGDEGEREHSVTS